MSATFLGNELRAARGIVRRADSGARVEREDLLALHSFKKSYESLAFKDSTRRNLAEDVDRVLHHHHDRHQVRVGVPTDLSLMKSVFTSEELNRLIDTIGRPALRALAEYGHDSSRYENTDPKERADVARVERDIIKNALGVAVGLRFVHVIGQPSDFARSLLQFDKEQDLQFSRE
jgi:hypothetical protein